jgi:hypothetical protein
MRKLSVVILALSLFGGMAVYANDCGQGKDKGKGTPTCPDKGGKGGNGGSGGSVSAPVTITNDNLNTVTVGSTNRNSNKSTSVSGAVSGSNSQSTVKDSGNSSNSNTNSATGGSATATAQGGAGGSATGGNATVSNGATGSGNSTTIGGDTTNYPRQTATAIAPETFPTVSCFKTYSGAGQAAGFGFSLGGGAIDQGCAAREEARLLAAMGSKVAACKILVATKAAKNSGVTLEDCVSGK